MARFSCNTLPDGWLINILQLFKMIKNALMSKYAILIISLIIHSQCGRPQSVTAYILSGNVTNEHKAPVEFAYAFLLKMGDSSITKYATVTEGKFKFDPVDGGRYILKIVSAGYSDACIPIVLDKDNSIEVELKLSADILKEVTIASARKLITNKNGNLKIDVEHSFFSTIPNPVDMLAALPTVQLSPDKESLSIVGSGVPLIYMDNQLISMNDLNTLSVSDIKSIEIIKNPSARYEADGKVVLLITRKVKKGSGMNLDVAEVASFKRLFNNYSSANISYKKDRLELKGSFQYNDISHWESNGNDFLIPGPDIHSAYTVLSIGKREQFIFGAGIYYQINDGDYFSVNASVRIQDEPFYIHTGTLLQEQATVNNILTYSNNYERRPYYNANVNYNKKLKRSNGNLFAGCKLSAYTRELGGDISNDYNSTGFVPAQHYYQNYTISIFAARTDFDKTFKNGLKLELGANMTIANAGSVFDVSEYTPSGYSATIFNYNEADQAGYVQLSDKWHGITYSAGLRVENTQVQGGYTDSAVLLVNKNYARLFPKAEVAIPIDSTKSINLNYSRTISRPDYSTASQISTYVNPFFEFTRNINIDPSITDAATATFQWKENSIGLTGYVTKNPVYYFTAYNSQTNILQMTNGNLQRETGAFLNLTVPVTWKKWTSTNVASVNISKVSDANAVVNTAKPYYYFYTAYLL